MSYTTIPAKTTLEAIILNVVAAIIRQDSTDKGAWTYVIIKKVARDTTFTEEEVTKEIQTMLKSEQLYENCYEILNGILHMVYVRNGDELLGSDN